MSAKITVTGWVGTQPRLFVSESGTSFTSFRLGSTKRYFDRVQDQWVDGATTWFTVKTWRTVAVNVAESLRKSDPVVVHGTLSTETWESPEGPRTTCVIEADSLGPDLARGQATFRHIVHHRAADEPEAADLRVDHEPSAATALVDDPDLGAPSDDKWAVDAADLLAATSG